MMVDKLNPNWLIKLCFLSLLIAHLSITSKAGEPEKGGGMYPVSLLKKAQLKSKGLSIPVNQIYDPGGKGLINSIVRIGGCTGSFVSGKGLILTNHHCVFGKLKGHSTEEKNYMETGFHADTREKEIPLEDMNVKIMKGYKDVSKAVLRGVDTIEDVVKRQARLNANQKKVRKKYQQKFPDLKVEVSEMLTGDSYVLFKYQVLKDLRLVYVPPRTVGEFGGSSDNWIWPRHTGDFSFVRAYVGPDGAPADYDKANVPFNPDVHLDVNPEGIKKDDFVFLLGYPGRTYRHRPSAFISYHKKVQLPYISSLFKWKIEQMERLSDQSESHKIRYDPKIKSLSNVVKNYKGKLETMEKVNLVQKRNEEEEAVYQKLGKANPEKQETFRKITKEMDSLYNELIDKGKKIFWYFQLLNSSNLMSMAREVHAFRERLKKNEAPESLDEEAFIRGMRQKIRKMDPNRDSIYLRKLLMQGLTFKGDNKIRALQAFFEDKKLTSFVKKAYNEKFLLDTAKLFQKIRENTNGVQQLNLPLVDLWNEIKPDFRKTQMFRRKVFSKIESLRPRYVNLKQEAQKGLFIPDANGTLRLTHGRVRGYNPRDAVHYKPFTGLKGYKEKAEPSGDYRAFPEMMNAIKSMNESVFERNKTNEAPICMLYDTDTSGGNSGSPVLDAKGNLVGLNFDRTYQGTITDYAWDESYSRSIGVDVRFILWYLANVDNADHLISEMGVSTKKD